MRIRENCELDFDDVLLLPQRTKAASRKDVILEREFKFYHSPRLWKGIPIMVANFDTTGVFGIAEKLMGLNVITVLHKFYKGQEIIDWFKSFHDTEQSMVNNYVWLSMGMKNDDFNKIRDVSSSLKYKPNLVIDVANGYTDDYVSYLSKVRNEFPESIICAGNVCSEEMVGEYILHGGVDIVKVGIGPGSVCITRKVAGVGRPQLSAIDVCSHKAHGLYSQERHLGLICGDGGCKTPGDVAKAFAANSDFVMLGGMIAGAEECQGEWEMEPYHYPISAKKKVLKFYGMSSREAMEKNSGGMSEYKASEGKCVVIPNKGPVEDIIKEICGGLRSCASYIGAKSLKEMSRCAEFVKVSRTHNTVFGV